GLFVSLLFMLATVILLDSVGRIGPSGVSLLAIVASALTPVLVTIRYVSRFGDPLAVVLGSDGALVRSRPGPVFIAYDDIEALQSCDTGVIVRRVDGSDHFIRTAEPIALSSALADKLDARPPKSSPVAS